ncbi:structural protein [Botrytis cinerea mycovirus 4]|uniref:Structural protein n=1 Tax=Botrytis cinerea mycovirus 4 TaxID=2732661 RepID=A0A858X7N2_9VIRU|nr:structural protein [Botrytis cinerea mycovirus 4]
MQQRTRDYTKTQQVIPIRTIKMEFSNEEQKAGQVAGAISDGESRARTRVMTTQLIYNNFSADYNAPKIIDSIHKVFGKFTVDAISHDLNSAPVVQVIEHTDVAAKMTDYGENKQVARQIAYSIKLAIGLNPNIAKMRVVANNNLNYAAAHVAMAHSFNTDSGSQEHMAYWSSTMKNSAVKELRDSMNSRMGENARAAYRIDNVDPTGFAFTVMMKLSLHNTAIREQSGAMGVRLRAEQPTNVLTMLSWPMSLEFCPVTKQVRGGSPNFFNDGNVGSVSTLQHAMLLMAETKKPVVRVKLTDGNPPTAVFDSFDSEANITSMAQTTVLESATDTRNSVYYLRKREDGRVWLTMPATGLFAQPRIATMEAQAQPTPGNVLYFLTHLQDYQPEVAFLLSKSRMRKVVSPSIIGTSESLSGQSYAPNQRVVIHFSSAKPQQDWQIYPRELATAALALLRGYGIKEMHYNSALVKLSELMAATYFMGSSAGAVSAPAYELVLPPVMTYGIQGLRATDVFGAATPQKAGMAIDFTHLPLAMGLVMTVGRASWLASMTRGKGEMVVEQSDTALSAAARLAIGKNVALTGLKLNPDHMSAVGTDDWRPAHAAASYIYSKGGAAAIELASTIAQCGSNAPQAHAVMRVAYGNDCYENAIPQMTQSLRHHTRTLDLRYLNGTAARAWHVTPQDTPVDQRVVDGLGDVVEMSTMKEATTHQKLTTAIEPNYTHPMVGVLKIRRVLHSLPCGTVEHAMLSAIESDQEGVVQLIDLVNRSREKQHAASDLVTAMVMVTNTPKLKTTMRKIGEDFGPRMITFSGVIPIAGLRSLAILTDGFELAPVAGRQLPSSISTSPEAMRKASAAGELVFQGSVKLMMARAIKLEMADKIAPLLSTHSSAVNGMMKNPGQYIAKYSPATQVNRPNPPLLFASNEYIPGAEYHDNEHDVTSENMTYYDLSDRRDAAKTGRHELLSLLGVDKSGVAQTFDNSVTDKDRKGGMTGMTKDALLAKFGKQKQKREEPTTKTIETVKIETRKVLMSTLSQVFAEVLAQGLQVKYHAAFRNWAIDVATAKGEYNSTNLSRSGGPLNSVSPSEPATFEQIKDELVKMGVVRATTIADPTELAVYLCQSRITMPEAMRDSLLEGPSAKSVRDLKHAITRVLHDELTVDMTTLCAPLYAWMCSPDYTLASATQKAIEYIVDLANDRDEVETYHYTLDKLIPSDQVDQRALDVIERLNAKSDKTLGVVVRRVKVPNTLTFYQALTLPAAKLGGNIFCTFSVINFNEEYLGPEAAWVKKLETAFCMDMHLTTGEVFDGKAAYKHNVETPGVQGVNDPRCMSYTDQEELHTALQLVSTLHMVYAARYWCPDSDKVGMLEELYNGYEATYKPYMIEKLQTPGAAYPTDQKTLHALQFTKIHE